MPSQKLRPVQKSAPGLLAFVSRQCYTYQNLVYGWTKLFLHACSIYLVRIKHIMVLCRIKHCLVDIRCPHELKV